MRWWMALGCVIALMGVGSYAAAAAPARATLAAPPASTLLPRPPRLPLPRYLPRITVRIRPGYIPPVIGLRPWRSLVGDLEQAQLLGITVDEHEAAAAIRRLFNRDNYKKLMVDAMCTAMEWLRRQGPPSLTFSTDEWWDYFVGYLNYFWRSRLQQYSQPHAKQVADGWLEAWAMTEVNPWLAAGYFRACVLAAG